MNSTFIFQVEFVDESGIDAGGLLREFFTLVFHAIAAKYFFSTGTHRHNSMALKVSIYYYYCLVFIYCGIF